MTDDYIKRSDARAYVRHAYAKGLNLLVAYIDVIPAANVEPVVYGSWIDENPASPLDPRMRCSICEHVEVPMWMWRFCPSCGAKMDAEPLKEESI